MCTAPHPAAVAAHALFLETNLGDPAHFPGAHALEQEVLADLADLLHAPSTAQGRFVSGGTEANILAAYLAREKTGKTHIVLSESAHFSFEKAARLLGMQLIQIPSRGGRADVKAMEAAITRETALVVAVAGTTELGLVDPVADMAKVCFARNVPLHVDAAYGGYILPFLAKPPRFDFHLPGVWSIAMDPHKFGMATIPAGVLLLRDASDWQRTAVRSPYLSTLTQSTLLGTRPGAAAAATWAVHRTLGRDGFARLVKTSLENARYLANGLRKMGVELVAEPELGVVTFRDPDAPGLAARLRAEGYSLNVVPRYQALRVVVNPHVERANLTYFLKVLKRCRA